ncbi:MAG: DNA adenine methylase [Bacteroidales bacterium]|nr:DNA adenine methylase [Bacteroidales bacterium]
MKTPITYYGGKQTMLKHIKPRIPKHKIYTEAFCGGAAVFFEKEASDIEVLNDINGELINFYQVFRQHSSEFKQELEGTLHSRNLHLYAQMIYQLPEHFSKVKRAWALWYLSKTSFASKLDGSFGYDKSKNTMVKKLCNAKEYAIAEAVAKRLENVQLECTDALRIIRSRDTIDAFHFVDPPYVGTNCGHYNGYNEQHFKELLDLLSNLEGKFMLTMFPNDMLQEYIDQYGWHKVEITRTISVSTSNRRKQAEWIIMNYNTV